MKANTKSDRTIEVCQMANDGVPTRDIAAHFGINTSSIRKTLRRYGVKSIRGTNPRKGKSTIQDKVDTICQMAKDGKTAQEIADHYNAQGFNHSAGRIYEILNRAGVHIERQKGNFKPEKSQQIIDMYNTGSKVTEIAKSLGYKGTARVSKVLCENGLRTHKPKRTDGYWEDNGGYLNVRVKDDDPMVCMRTKRGTILEHRLNLARKLGRPLTAEETAHHIDGNKQNNDPSNLQLRKLYHGKGVAMNCFDCKSINIVSGDFLKCGDCDSTKISFSEL